MELHDSSNFSAYPWRCSSISNQVAPGILATIYHDGYHSHIIYSVPPRNRLIGGWQWFDQAFQMVKAVDSKCHETMEESDT